MKLKSNDVIARLTDNNEVKKYCVIDTYGDITYMRSYPYGENAYIYKDIFGYGSVDNMLIQKKDVIEETNTIRRWVNVPVFFYTKSILCNPNVMSSRSQKGAAIRIYRSIEQAHIAEIELRRSIRKRKGLVKLYLNIKYSYMIFKSRLKMKKYRKVLDIV